MDWGRAKTILILSFLCLNLFLGYQLWEEKQQQGIQGQISQLQIDELKQRLAFAGIEFVEEEIPEEVPEMSNMKVLVAALKEQSFSEQVETVNWDNEQLEVVFTHPLVIPDNVTDSDRAKWYRDQIAQFDHYQRDTALSTSSTHIYTQQIEGYPVFTSRLQLLFTEQGWIGYKQNYYIPEEKGVSRQIVSAYTTLAVLLENGLLSAGEKIIDVQLGYTIEHLDANVQFLVPVWRVIHSDGIHFINGFTGMVIGATNNE